MPVRKFKPTSPGRRFMSVSTFEEITKSKPGEDAHREADEEGRPQQLRAHHDAPPGRRPQAPLPRRRLQAQEGRRPGQGRRDRVRPEPLGAHRAAALRRRREELHPRAGAAAGRDDGRVRPGRRHQARQRAAAGEHPDRHARPQRRAEAGPGRQDGAQRRLGHPARREGPAATPCSVSRPGSCAGCC